MTIATYDQLLAGCQPPVSILKTAQTQTFGGSANGSTWFSYYTVSGYPAAATAPSSGLSGSAITSRAGQIPFTNPGSGSSYLARLSLCSDTYLTPATIVLVDRLWDNSGISVTTTTAQTINSATWPARDINGSTSGVGVMVGLESYSAIGGGSVSNTTITYTGTVNGASQTGSLIQSWPGSALQGTFVPFSLTAGDTGVTSIQSITLGTSYVSGTISLVAYRILAYLHLPNTICLANGAENSTGAYNAIDAYLSGMPKLYNNTCMFLYATNNSILNYAPNLYGNIVVAQG